MKITAEPRSDQWNADDFIGGPRTFTIAGVKPGAAEQKYDVELVEGGGRVWRPPVTVLRLLIAAWGDEAKDWTGRRVTLYRDDSIRFGPEAVGGVRVSHMSNLPGDKPFETRLTSTRGKKTKHRVEPLPADAPTTHTEPSPDEIAACDSTDELRAMWSKASAGTRKLIEDRVSELNATPAPEDIPDEQFAGLAGGEEG